MKAVIQRVRYAELFVNGHPYSSIHRGIVALIGLMKNDTAIQAEKLADKLIHFRIFPDPKGRMNLSVPDIQGDILLVPQFTLAAETKKGLKPSFSSAMPPDEAEPLFNYLVARVRQECAEQSRGTSVATGKFQATMNVSLVNEGPVTFILTF